MENKKLSAGDIALGVFFGNLLTGVVSALVVVLMVRQGTL